MRYRHGSVSIWVSDDIYSWPGHRQEIQSKVDELNELIHSLETGQTEQVAVSTPRVIMSSGAVVRRR